MSNRWHFTQPPYDRRPLHWHTSQFTTAERITGRLIAQQERTVDGHPSPVAGPACRAHLGRGCWPAAGGRLIGRVGARDRDKQPRGPPGTQPVAAVALSPSGRAIPYCDDGREAQCLRIAAAAAAAGPAPFPGCNSQPFHRRYARAMGGGRGLSVLRSLPLRHPRCRIPCICSPLPRTAVIGCRSPGGHRSVPVPPRMSGH